MIRSGWTYNGKHFAETRSGHGQKFFIDGKRTRYEEWNAAFEAARTVEEQLNERARNLYQQIQDQRAVLRSYEEALSFVRIRQSETPKLIEPIARKLWQITRENAGST